MVLVPWQMPAPPNWMEVPRCGIVAGVNRTGAQLTRAHPTTAARQLRIGRVGIPFHYPTNRVCKSPLRSLNCLWLDGGNCTYNVFDNGIKFDAAIGRGL